MSDRHVFIADVHLFHEETDKRDQLVRFFSNVATPGVNLYILGDLFDIWIGEDQLESEPELIPVFDAMKLFVNAGGKLVFFHGNRDFMMCDYLSCSVGAETVPYSKTILVNGHKVYLNHGDMLCTGDTGYHVVRWLTRSWLSKQVFKRLPAGVRYAVSGSYRNVSRKQDPGRSRERHGINVHAVRALMRRKVDVIVCGHVHEHRHYLYRFRDREVRVISLPPWPEPGSVLEYSDGSFVLKDPDLT